MRITAPKLNGAEPWLDPDWNGDWPEIKNVTESQAVCILALRSMPYGEYLATEHWAQIRRDTWRMQRGQCDLCTNRIDHIHHHHYARRGFERDGDVVGLCSKCHEAMHWILTAKMKASIHE